MSSIFETIDGNNPGREELKEILAELRRLKETDIRDVDPDSLVEISEVEINTDLTQADRLIDYLKKVKNPYCYKIHGVVVKVNFTGKASIDDCLEEALFGGGTSKI